MTTFDVTYLALWILALLQGIVALVLVDRLRALRLLGSIGRAKTEIAVGMTVPDFTATDVASGKSTSSALLRGNVRVLLALSTDCSSCSHLANELKLAPAEALRGLVVLCLGKQAACRTVTSTLSRHVPVLQGEEITMAFGGRLPGLPIALLIDERWNIAAMREVAAGDHVLESLRQPPPAPSRSEFAAD